MEKYLNPFTDYDFKRIFGDAYHQDLLIDFLNQVLQPAVPIRSLTFLNPENQGRTDADRRAIFDLYCEDERGDRFIVELQNIYQPFFKERSLYYATFPLQEQGEKGRTWDYRQRGVYIVSILNFVFPESNNGQVLRTVMLTDTASGEVFYQKLKFIYVQVPNFGKTLTDLRTQFDRWLYVLKHLSALERVPKELSGRIFEKLFTVAEVAKLNRKDMDAYQQSLKIYRDNMNTTNYLIQTAVEKAVGEAVEKAVGEAVEKTTEETNARRSREIALKAKQRGIDVKTIVELTGLTEGEIEAL